jgi:hypothetical protein
MIRVSNFIRFLAACLFHVNKSETPKGVEPGASGRTVIFIEASRWGRGLKKKPPWAKKKDE